LVATIGGKKGRNFGQFGSYFKAICRQKVHHFTGDIPLSLPLFFPRHDKDCRAILTVRIGSFPTKIVKEKELTQYRFVANYARIINNFYRFRVPCLLFTDFLVGRIGGMPTGKTYPGVLHSG
jgi:hypothetical protein